MSRGGLVLPRNVEIRLSLLRDEYVTHVVKKCATRDHDRCLAALHLAPPASRDQPGQCRERQPVARLVGDPADLAAQHRVVVPEHQQFGVLGHLTPGQHHQAAEQAAYGQVDHREDRSAMIPARKTAQASSRNRARYGGCGQDVAELSLVARKAALYRCGACPRARVNCCRKPTLEPNPT